MPGRAVSVPIFQLYDDDHCYWHSSSPSSGKLSAIARVRVKRANSIIEHGNTLNHFSIGNRVWFFFFSFFFTSPMGTSAWRSFVGNASRSVLLRPSKIQFLLVVISFMGQYARNVIVKFLKLTLEY